MFHQSFISPSIVTSPSRHTRRQPPELLAPAGDQTALTAALKAGCDAIYLGCKSFNMRGAPRNFTLPQVRKAHDLCHENGARLYVTVNTIVYDREFPAVQRLLDGLVGIADAVICWDPAVIGFCRERGIPIHVSTQASIANAAAAEFYRSLGASRLVLARECTLTEIRAIAHKTDIGLEVFAHGAMCVSVSGRCYLSDLTYGASGNRGECRQNCRRPYRVICQDGPGDFEVTPGDTHIFSAKDLCTLPFLDKVLATGVVSLKIEGRNRPADYVDTVIRAYREALDAWAQHALTPELKTELTSRCLRVFNREFSDGFYFGRPICEFTERQNSAATEHRTHLGKVLNYYPRSGIAHIAVHNPPLAHGDTVVIMGPTTGIVRTVVDNPRFEENPDGKPSLTATFKVPDRVRANDLVFKISPRVL